MDCQHGPEDAGLGAYHRYLDGDGGALEAFIGAYRRGLTLFLLGFVGNLADAEDLMMDTFARFAVKGRQFQGRASLKTYLYAIGRNLALRHLKKHRRDRHLPLADHHPAPDNPELEFLRGEDRQRLYAAMGQLPDGYRETLYLLYFEDMSYAEAGRVLHKTEKQIGDLAHRGRQALKARMESGAEHHAG